MKKVNLGESGGDGDEESGGGPEESAEGDDGGAVVADGEVGGEWVTRGLDDGSEEREGAEASGVRVQRRADFLVHSRQQRFIGAFHYSRQIYQNQS